MPAQASAEKFLDELVKAANDHDIDALVDCFAEDYRNETPLHPARDFVGRQQVRANWVQILAGTGDLRATVVRRVLDGSTVWAEWEFTGTRPDRTPQLMRGVTVFGTDQGRAAWSRFYLEPVEQDGEPVGRHLRATLGGDDADA